MASTGYNGAELSPEDPRYGYQLTEGQAAREHARSGIYYTLKEIERAIDQAEKARARVREADLEPNLDLALRSAAEQLQATRDELFKSTYFGGDQQKLL